MLRAGRRNHGTDCCPGNNEPIHGRSYERSLRRGHSRRGHPGAGTPAPEATPTFNAQPGAVTLVAYSTPREAYAELIPLFQATPADRA